MDQTELKQLLHYDPGTGVFIWLPRPRTSFSSDRAYRMWHTRYCGTEAGHICRRDRYRKIRVGLSLYMAHRLAFLYMEGHWPADQVDHDDHDRANNRWDNLFECDGFKNHKNVTKRRDNTSGVTGVNWDSNRQKWAARIRVPGTKKGKTLGRFKSKLSACVARWKAEIEYGYHVNHGR